MMTVNMTANPPDFDVWGKMHPGAMRAAAAWTAKMQAISMLDAYKTVRHSLAEHGRVQIAVRCGWEDVGRLLQVLPAFVAAESCLVSQATYLPERCGGYCAQHGLHYARQACPLCEGDYISHVIDGRRYAAPRSARPVSAL